MSAVSGSGKPVISPVICCVRLCNTGLWNETCLYGKNWHSTSSKRITIKCNGTLIKPKRLFFAKAGGLLKTRGFNRYPGNQARVTLLPVKASIPSLPSSSIAAPGYCPCRREFSESAPSINGIPWMRSPAKREKNICSIN